MTALKTQLAASVRRSAQPELGAESASKAPTKSAPTADAPAGTRPARAPRAAPKPRAPAPVQPQPDASASTSTPRSSAGELFPQRVWPD
mgnify:CR=1 FL=1|jgi:hypothetical protein